MKSYKDYEKKYIGMSDIANLILAGSSDNGLKLAVLHFGMDNVTMLISLMRMLKLENIIQK